MRHLAADFIVVSDVSKCSAPELRHLGGEKKIGLAANGDGIQKSVAQITAQRGEYFFFIAKIAISKKNDVAQIAGKLRFAHQVKQSGQHLCAAASLQTLHIMARRSQVFGGGGKRLRREFTITATESQNAETVCGHERIKRLKQRTARLLNGRALH